MGQKAFQNDLSRFDLWEFCRAKAQLSSRSAVFPFERLHSDQNVSDVISVDWELCGTQNLRGESTVQIRGIMRVKLICVHCGDPFEAEVSIARNWVLTRSEQEAEDYDEGDLGEQDDVVACEGYADVPQWVEDELLLSLPMLPAHDYVCVGSNSASDEYIDLEPEAQEPVETHKPFANLDQLIKQPKN
jgi:uncharacterized protein